MNKYEAPGLVLDKRKSAVCAFDKRSHRQVYFTIGQKKNLSKKNKKSPEKERAQISAKAVVCVATAIAARF